MERLQKEPEIIPAPDNLVQKAPAKTADEEHEKESSKTKSFMESSDSVLGAAQQQMPPPGNCDVWFPKDGTTALDTVQLNLLNQLATDPAVLSGAVTIMGIEGGSLMYGLPNSDMGAALEVANARATSVLTALSPLAPSITPSNKTVADYKAKILGNADVENQLINGNEAKLYFLFNTQNGGIIRRINRIALQLDAHTR